MTHSPGLIPILDVPPEPNSCHPRSHFNLIFTAEYHIYVSTPEKINVSIDFTLPDIVPAYVSFSTMRNRRYFYSFFVHCKLECGKTPHLRQLTAYSTSSNVYLDVLLKI